MRDFIRSFFSKMLVFAAFLLPSIVFSYGKISNVIPEDQLGHEWMEAGIEEEFVFYNTQKITLENLDYTWNVCQSNPYKACFKRYQVIDSKVYGPEGSMKNLLTEMVLHYKVPDVDFIYLHADDMKEDFLNTYFSKNNAPILVSAKQTGTNRVICFVDWYYDIYNQEGWNGLIARINNYQAPWEKKIPKLFWRGTTTDGAYNISNWINYPRGRSVYYSLRYPEKVDSAFYQVFMAPQDLELFKKRVGISSFVPIEDHLHYKYQFLTDGITCTFPGTQWRLLSGCLAFQPKTNNIMWFYRELIPGKHFISVSKDLSDLIEKLDWAIDHDQEARKIAETARDFALTHLMPEHILLYCYKSLVKYASLQTFSPNNNIR